MEICAARAPSSLGLLAVGLCLISGCPRGDSFHELDLVVRSPAYPRPRCAKGPATLGKLETRGTALAGVTIKLTPIDRRLKTDKAGRAHFGRLPSGNYRLSFFAAGFRPEPPRALTVNSSRRIEQELSPCVGVPPRHRVGFDREIELRAQNRCDNSWNEAKVSWQQLEGPTKVLPASGWRLRFRTATLRQARGSLPERAQVLSFSHDQAGEYVFRLTATRADGVTSQSYVFVSATDATTGMTSVAPQLRYYLAGPASGPYDWKLTSADQHLRVQLERTDRRTPSVVLNVSSSALRPQTVVITERHAGLVFSLIAGNWNLVPRDCGRSGCHTSLTDKHEKTRHGQTWRYLVDGLHKLARGPLAESCADCHALGWHPDVDNGGYDDVARQLSLGISETGNYNKLPQPLRDVSNVYCLACHGPGRVDPPVAEQPGLFSAGVCARCHDRLPEQTTVAQWRKSRHSRQDPAADFNGPQSRPPCRKCHSAQGFYRWQVPLSRPHESETLALVCCAQPQPISCQACHNAMSAEKPSQLYLWGDAPLADGQLVNNQGSGAGCLPCHSASSAAAEDAPHAPQTNIALGRGGFALAPAPLSRKTACAAKATNSCVTCHMAKLPAGDTRQLGGHTFQLKQKDGTRLDTICHGCHKDRRGFDAPAGDIDGDGNIQPLVREVASALQLLKKQIDARIAAARIRGCSGRLASSFATGHRQKIVLVDQRGDDLGDCDKDGQVARTEEPQLIPDTLAALKQATHNYFLVANDKSGGLHNPPFVIELLQRSLAATR
ncbi:MAG: hypothetical protein H6707_05895 [Deltaproteobacteria bacterium]|nr:hypothetical protein [Deltaproteobacteria bacterium]